MKKKRSLGAKIIIGVFGLGCLYAIFIFGLILSSFREVPPKGVDTLIVLGARVMGDVPAEPSKPLKERLDTAYNYLIENEETIVIVTGGQGSDESEPEGVAMGRYLESKGIEPERIIVEKTSTSTIENIRNASELHDISESIVVSNDYHIYRAKHIARLNGVDTVYGLAAPSKSFSTFISYVREIAALGYHFIFTR